MRARWIAAIAVTCLMHGIQVAPATAAPGVNLRWNQCYGDGGTIKRVFACTSNTGVNSMVGSFVVPGSLSDVTGIEVRVDLLTASTTLPAWWQFFTAGACRHASLSSNATISAAAVNCVDWANGAAAGGVAAYQAGTNGLNSASIRLGFAVADAMQLSSDVEYFAFNININNTKTVGTGSCAGCAVPACLALNSLKVVQAGGGSMLLTTGAVDGLSNYVTWQGGGGLVCANGDSAGYSLLTSVLGHGQVTRSRTVAHYLDGSPVTLAAVPDAGMKFATWSGDTSTTADTLQIVVTRNLSYTAEFEQDAAAAPILLSMEDVRGDEGGSLRATWTPSPIDSPMVLGALCCYRVERRGEVPPDTIWAAAGPTIPAHGNNPYSCIVATPADSTGSDPASYRYRVVAVASSYPAEWVSNELSGWSVDDLAPPPPASVSGVIATGQATLFWSASAAADVDHYSVYRNLQPSPVLDVAHRLATTASTNFTDTPGYFANYWVTATDVHGNESSAAPFIPLNATGTPPRTVPRALEVGAVHPSPARSIVSLSVGLPRAMPLRVDVLDTQGRLVCRLRDGLGSAGWHELAWDTQDASGRSPSAGVYFVHVQTPEGSRIRRVAVIR